MTAGGMPSMQRPSTGVKTAAGEGGQKAREKITLEQVKTWSLVWKNYCMPDSVNWLSAEYCKRPCTQEISNTRSSAWSNKQRPYEYGLMHPAWHVSRANTIVKNKLQSMPKMEMGPELGIAKTRLQFFHNVGPDLYTVICLLANKWI